MAIIRLGLRSSFCLCLLLAGCTTTQSPRQVTRTEAPAAVREPVSELSGTDATSSESTTTEEKMLWQKLAQADEESYVVLLRHAIAPRSC